MKIVLTLIIMGTAAFFGGCQRVSVDGTSSAPVSETTTRIKEISVTDAKQATERGDVQFIDVRTAEEYAVGHALKAVNFPLDSLEQDLAKLDQDKPVYVICQTGARSKKGSEILQKAGFKELYNIRGGTSAWTAAGLPTAKQ